MFLFIFVDPLKNTIKKYTTWNKNWPDQEAKHWCFQSYISLSLDSFTCPTILHHSFLSNGEFIPNIFHFTIIEIKKKENKKEKKKTLFRTNPIFTISSGKVRNLFFIYSLREIPNDSIIRIYFNIYLSYCLFVWVPQGI